MKESKFTSSSRFKTLSDEDLFNDEAEPLNTILFKFKHWPRNGNKLYTRRSMLVCGILIFSFGFLSSFIIFNKLNFIFGRNTAKENTLSLNDVWSTMVAESTGEQNARLNASLTMHTHLSDYNEVSMLREHFQANNFDQISSIITSEVVLTFKNKLMSDKLEIVVDEGDIRYSNVRNATYTYAIPDEADQINNFTNKISGLPVYANFGSEDDFNFLTDQGISLHGHIVLFRLGKTSILNKVSGALRRGARGVLLFADPQQYPQSDCLFVHEEMSPLLLTDLQKLGGTLNCNKSNCGVAVQIIEAMTARNILREMARKSPDSWHGSLRARYPIGPGFENGSWRLVMYTNFISVRYKTYDIAAYLRGTQEPDRYVVVANSRRSLNEKSKTFESTHTLVEVSKAFAELKNKKQWIPTRTLLFVSFGLEDCEFSPDSWVQKHIDVLKDRTVAYLNLKQPVKGLGFVAAVSPVMESVFANMSASVEIPHKINETNTNRTLSDMWPKKPKLSIKNHTKLQSCDDSNRTAGPLSSSSSLRVDTAGSEMFSSFGVPTITFGFADDHDLTKTDGRVDIIPNIQKYTTAIIQLWKILAFSLAQETILPFNLTAYAAIIENYNEALFSQQKTLHNLSIMNDFDAFNHSTENLTHAISKFQNDIRTSESTNTARNRMVNEKLMHMQKLFTCVLKTYDFIFSLSSETEAMDVEVVRNELRRGKNCVAELDYHFVSSLYY